MADGARPQREPMRHSADTASRTNVEMEKVDRGPMTFMCLEVLVKHVQQMAIAACFRLCIAAKGTTDVPGPTLDACGAQTRRIMTQTRCLVTAVELGTRLR